MCLFVLQNEWQSNILVRLYQIMFKISIVSQIGADRYKKLILEILLLSPPLGELWSGCVEYYIAKDGNSLAQNIAHVNLETV